MNSAGLLVIMAMKLHGNEWPQTLNLKEVQIVCKSISSTISKEGYRYVGFNSEGVAYMTDLTDIDALQSEINSQCDKK